MTAKTEIPSLIEEGKVKQIYISSASFIQIGGQLVNDNDREGTLKDFFLTGYVWNFGIMLLNIFSPPQNLNFFVPTSKRIFYIQLSVIQILYYISAQLSKM